MSIIIQRRLHCTYCLRAGASPARKVYRRRQIYRRPFLYVDYIYIYLYVRVYIYMRRSPMWWCLNESPIYRDVRNANIYIFAFDLGNIECVSVFSLKYVILFEGVGSRVWCGLCVHCGRLYTAFLYPIRGGHHFRPKPILAQRRRDQRVAVVIVRTEQADAQLRQMAGRMLADRAAGGDALVAAATQSRVTLLG